MHVLVTGATGFVGFHTVKALLKAGHTVRLGIRSEEKMQAVYNKYGIPCDDFVAARITDVESVRQALKGCDGVVHTAALVSMKASDAQAMMETNLGGTQHVIGLAIEMGIKSIVHVSSVSAFDAFGDGEITETTRYAQTDSGYGASKRAASSKRANTSPSLTQQASSGQMTQQ